MNICPKASQVTNEAAGDNQFIDIYLECQPQCFTKSNKVDMAYPSGFYCIGCHVSLLISHKKASWLDSVHEINQIFCEFIDSGLFRLLNQLGISFKIY